MMTKPILSKLYLPSAFAVLVGAAAVLAIAADGVAAAPIHAKDIAAEITCALWPTSPGCPPLQCPPDCLSQPGPKLAAANKQLRERLGKTSIKVQQRRGQIRLSNSGGNPVVLNFEVRPASKGNRVVSFAGSAAGKDFRWQATYSPSTQTVDPGPKAQEQFTAFVRAAKANYGPDLRLVVNKPGGVGPVKDETGDRIFCGVLGILTGAANPVGGAAIYAMCEWFASNGLD